MRTLPGLVVGLTLSGCVAPSRTATAPPSSLATPRAGAARETAPPGAAAPPAPGPASVDCALDLAAIEGHLDHRATSVVTVATPRRVGRQLHEAVRFADGVVLSFTTGGCAHYGYTIAYEPVSAAALAGGPTVWSTTAQALLARGAIDADTAAPFVAGLALAPVARRDDELDLVCGEATCTLRVEQVGGGAARLVLAYDFAL